MIGRYNGELVVSEHAIDRWCERMNTKLDKHNPEDRQQAARELVEAFRKYAKFSEYQENGRRLYTYSITRHVNGRQVVEDVSIVVEVDGKEIITCWSNERIDDRELYRQELRHWKRQQQRRLRERLSYV